MTDPRQEKDLFEQAMDLATAEERQQFLRQACGDDSALLARVQGLLSALDQAGDFLAGPPNPQAANLPPPEQNAAGPATVLEEKVGERLGRYQLLEKIGEGGCGMVYMAEQVEPVRRRVALKVVKLGMDTRQVIARFEAERQALAVMDHPHIAKVFDAGATATGRPYFVMELVHGVRITRFCDERQLPLRARLELLVQVCGAIQHAHQKGLIHRDLKPSNILVALSDGAPAPKVIDFGISKATQGNLAEQTLFTRFEQFLGTPAYMSPEQAEVREVDIDTRSDIYSLGVVLYELLTGRTPLDSQALLKKGIEELILALREVEPPRPSMCLSALALGDLQTVARAQRSDPPKLARSLRGDLDWIVMKCLEKDRTRRYDTVNGLAMDLRRYLNNEPVLARPPTAIYRLQKAFRRHKAAFAAAGAVLAALVLGLGLATYGIIRVKTERDIADQARLAALAQKKIADGQRQKADASAQAALREQENTRRALAGAQTALAEAAYREQNGPAMKAALEAVPMDLRDGTWNYLLAHADTSLTTLNQRLIGAAAHPTLPGVFAVAEAGGGLALVEARTGKILAQIQTTPRQRQAFYQRGLAISPDGLRIAAGSLGQGGLAIYDLRAGRLLVEWEAPETDLLEYSADGGQLLQSSSIDGQACLWEAAAGRLLWTLKTSSRAVFDPAGKRIIATHGAELIVLDPASGGILKHLCPLRSATYALAVRPGGQSVVFGDKDGCVQAVDLKDGHTVFERPAHQNIIRFLAFTADGRRFVTVADGEGQRQSIKVWDAETGTHLQSVLGGVSQAESLRIHPLTDEMIITGHVSKTWALSGEQPKWALPGGATAAFVGGSSFCLGRTAESGMALFGLGAAPSTPAWFRNEPGAWLAAASADGRVAAAVKSGNLASQISILRQTGGMVEESRAITVPFAVSLVRLSPAGDRIMAFVPQGLCSGQFDTATGASLPRLEGGGSILWINDLVWLNRTQVVGAVTANAARGAPGSVDGLALWDAPSGQRLRIERCAALVNRLAQAPDGGSFAEAGEDKMVRIRSAQTLGILSEFRAHDASITALAWHPARPILATAAADLTIKLWDLSRSCCLKEFRGPLKPVQTLHFSPDGRRLVSAGTDGTRIWEPVY